MADLGQLAYVRLVRTRRVARELRKLDVRLDNANKRRDSLESDMAALKERLAKREVELLADLIGKKASVVDFNALFEELDRLKKEAEELRTAFNEATEHVARCQAARDAKKAVHQKTELAEKRMEQLAAEISKADARTRDAKEDSELEEALIGRLVK